jgi:hypothetical protein
MADDKKSTRTPDEIERERSAQFGRIAAWTEQRPKRAPEQDDEHEERAAEAS